MSLAPCVASSAVALGIPAAASAATAVYELTGTATTTPGGGCFDCSPTTMDASGTAACPICLPGKPAGASFKLETIATTYPSDPIQGQERQGDA